MARQFQSVMDLMDDYTALPRSQWLDIARNFYARLRAELSGFSPSDWERVSPYLGWRNRDLLGHMASAISVNFRQVLDRALAGDPSAPPEFNTFARNGREVARRRHIPVPETLDELWNGLESILDIYARMSDADWLRPAWFFVGPVNVRTLFLTQLGDNVFHERDMLLVAGRWRGLDTTEASPLVDWFLREVRPALFRPEKAAGLSATALFRLSGTVSGEWTMRIGSGVCTMGRGGTPEPDVIIEADAEDLVVSAQARAAPFFGRLSRWLDWMGGPDHREDVAATITGYASAIPAVLFGRIRVSRNRALANRINQCFWHFWERSEQTEFNIALSRSTQH